jgi:hypothetical protein
MKFRVFWDVEPCGHVEVDRRFRGAYCLHHQKTLKLSETLSVLLRELHLLGVSENSVVGAVFEPKKLV